MYRRYIKRSFDIIFSILLLPFCLPIIFIISCLVKVEDGGQIFYSAQRLGKDGITFKMFKFRSMMMNAPDIRNQDGSTFNSSDDPRVTKIGRILRKTSLDELPQIFNVLIGDMSFIGPRPDLPEQRVYYEAGEEKRLAVLPGISGYNQSYFRNSISWKQRIENDIYYVENLTFIFDVKILFKTIHSILFQKGIFIEDSSAEVKGVEESV